MGYGHHTWIAGVPIPEVPRRYLTVGIADIIATGS